MISPESLLARFPDAPLWRLSHPNGEPYLDRYVLWGDDCLDTHTGAKSHCFLHRIYTADGDRDCHDHGWLWSVGIILSGGYVERRQNVDEPEARYGYDVGESNFIRNREYHSIVSVQPDTWTLFLAGPEVSVWGFRVNGQHVPHKEYFAADGTLRMTHARIR